MASEWSWDPTLFAGSAAFYSRGRLPYSDELVSRLVSRLGLDGTGRLVDLGCGPGTVVVPLASHYAEVTGLDPDPDMIEHGKALADELGVANASWVVARAEEFKAAPDSCRTIVVAQSFHWMDQTAVADKTMKVLAPGCSLVHITDEKPEGDPAPGQPPFGEVRELVTEYLGPERRAGQGVLPNGTPDGEDKILTRAGFLGPDKIIVPGGKKLDRTVDDVVAWVYSRSGSAPHLFGDRLSAFEGDLRAILEDSMPGGGFTEVTPDTVVHIWEKPE